MQPRSVYFVATRPLIKSTTLQTATPYKPPPYKTRRVNLCLSTKQIFKNPIPYQLQPFFL